MILMMNKFFHQFQVLATLAVQHLEVKPKTLL